MNKLKKYNITPDDLKRMEQKEQEQNAAKCPMGYTKQDKMNEMDDEEEDNE